VDESIFFTDVFFCLQRAADLSKKQSKDPEVEKLIPSKGQGKVSQ